MTLSDFVQRATFPAPAKVLSDVVNSVLPSNSMVKRSPTALMPSACHSLPVTFVSLPVNLFSTTFNNAVETNVVLKRIGTNDVIVVAIKETNGNACRLIDASRDRFEPYGNINVFGDDWFKNGERKTIVGSICTGLFDHSASK